MTLADSIDVAYASGSKGGSKDAQSLLYIHRRDVSSIRPSTPLEAHTNARRLGRYWHAISFAQAPLTNDAIVKMVKSGLGDDVVISAVQTQQGNYSTSPDDLVALKTVGVSDKLIAAIMAKAAGAGRGVSGAGGLPEPEFQMTVYWFDGGHNRLVALERANTDHTTKGVPVPFTRAKAVADVGGERSPIRIAADGKVELVLQAPQNVDPQSLAEIFSLTVKKGKRELITATRGALGGVHHTTPSKDVISFQASKYSDTSIKITPAMPLPRGEYAVRLLGGPLFCFGVD